MSILVENNCLWVIDEFVLVPKLEQTSNFPTYVDHKCRYTFEATGYFYEIMPRDR